MPGVRVIEIDLSGGGNSSGALKVKTTVKDLTGGPPRQGGPRVEVREIELPKK